MDDKPILPGPYQPDDHEAEELLIREQEPIVSNGDWKDKDEIGFPFSVFRKWGFGAF